MFECMQQTDAGFSRHLEAGWWQIRQAVIVFIQIVIHGQCLKCNTFVKAVCKTSNLHLFAVLCLVLQFVYIFEDLYTYTVKAVAAECDGNLVKSIHLDMPICPYEWKSILFTN